MRSYDTILYPNTFRSLQGKAESTRTIGLLIHYQTPVSLVLAARSLAANNVGFRGKSRSGCRMQEID